MFLQRRGSLNAFFVKKALRSNQAIGEWYYPKMNIGRTEKIMMLAQTGGFVLGTLVLICFCEGLNAITHDKVLSFFFAASISIIALFFGTKRLKQFLEDNL